MLSLLLHMHQPDYRHPRTGVPIMPWVRLHGTRGYRDVPRIIAETGARVTVNLVPTLIEQIDRYAAGGSDLHLDLCRRNADSLSAAEAAWFVEHALHGSPRAFGWFAGWGALRNRRERGERFSTRNLRDLQVWCNLAWFGATALEDHPTLVRLRRKGEGFTEEEKQFVLDVQRACLGELRALYAVLPDVTATPYAHPILPLLIDSGHAARNLGPFDDPGFRAPQDAFDQLVEGRRAVGAWIGRDVNGLWPSEGSVSPEAVDLFAKAGFHWFAADNGVLARSAEEGSGPVWQVGAMKALFRDHGLSDRVGFVYADHSPEAAVDDLLTRVGDRRVFLALDGENPWESYRDAGAGFLRELFQRGQFTTCGDLAAEPPTGRVHALHTGSWIGADFRIWIGAPEDQAAWRLLRRVREAFERSAQPDDARRSLWRAQASDWFWWYGPEFTTPFAGDFDVLFRAHLADVLEKIGAPPMSELNVPVAAGPGPGTVPTGPIFPDRADFFAWSGGGVIPVTTGSMAPGPGWPAQVQYGWSGKALHVRLVGPGGAPVADGWRAEIEDTEGKTPSLVLWTPEGRRVPESGRWSLRRPIPRPEG